MLRGIFRTEDVAQILATAAEAPDRSLRRSLGPFQVTLFGVGAIIGAGIFATIGTAAAGDAVRLGAGPSLTLSFVIIGIVCAFTALRYAEIVRSVTAEGRAAVGAFLIFAGLAAGLLGVGLTRDAAPRRS